MAILEGTCKNETSSTQYLMDYATNFLDNMVNPGCVIINVTTGGSSVVIGIPDLHSVIFSPLAGGTRDTFIAGDEYQVYTDPPAIIKDWDILYDVIPTFKFAARVIDARHGSRTRYYEIQRFGVDVLFKPSYDTGERDQFSGTGNVDNPYFALKEQVGGTLTRAARTADPTDLNVGTYYGPTQKWKAIIVRPTMGVNVSQYGIISQGNAIIIVDVYRSVRRGDLFRDHNDIWKVMEVPEFEYARNREIIGQKLTVQSLKNSRVNW